MSVFFLFFFSVQKVARMPFEPEPFPLKKNIQKLYSKQGQCFYYFQRWGCSQRWSLCLYFSCHLSMHPCFKRQAGATYILMDNPPILPNEELYGEVAKPYVEDSVYQHTCSRLSLSCRCCCKVWITESLDFRSSGILPWNQYYCMTRCVSTFVLHVLKASWYLLE